MVIGIMIVTFTAMVTTPTMTLVVMMVKTGQQMTISALLSVNSAFELFTPNNASHPIK